jgi:paraquat-inducible protein A
VAIGAAPEPAGRASTGGRSLARRSRGADRLLGPMLVIAMGLLGAGLSLPFFTVKRLFILEDKLSVLQSLVLLFEEGEYLLFAVLLAFTVLFPFGKLLLASLMWFFVDVASARLRRTVGWLDALGKWSMLDVFVVALLVISVKTSLIGDVAVHAGLYLFLAAIVVSGLALRRISRLAQAAVAGGR